MGSQPTTSRLIEGRWVGDFEGKASMLWLIETMEAIAIRWEVIAGDPCRLFTVVPTLGTTVNDCDLQPCSNDLSKTFPEEC